MIDPQETLAIFAEVSVALVGFSGIVMAFSGRSVQSFNRLELRRLNNLFILGGMGIIFSLSVMACLHLDLGDAASLWQGASLVLCLFTIPWLAWDLLQVTRLEEQQRSEVNNLLLGVFDVTALLVILLNVANIFVLKQDWPFFVALVLIVTGALQQFILLVRVGIAARE